MSHPIPAAALERHIGILGKTGSGKSNTAKVLAEGIIADGGRVCVIDPTGTWWGIRLAPDGKKQSAFKPVIFGGNHADIQIAAEHGAAVGEAIATASSSAIIDTRVMTVGARTRFFTAFGEALLRSNRGPLHLIIDEAHLFMPQGRVNDPASGAMLHAANNLVSLGRGLGLRIILISQRPAKIHKDSLTQVETLVAMRLIAPQDRRAIEDWIGEWADPGKGKEITASLPSLPTGTAWVWSPEIDVLERVKFPLAATFDSGKPLSLGEAAPELTPINIEEIGTKLDSIRQDAQANDPARLKRTIADLQKQLATKPVQNIPENIPALVEAAEKLGYESGRSDTLHEGARAIEALMAWMLARVGDFQGEIKDQFNGVLAAARLPAKPRPAPATSPSPVQPLKREVASSQKTEASGFSGPETRVLRSIALWASLGHDRPTRPMVAGAAGYSPGSGGFGNLLGRLRTAGAIDYPEPGRVTLLMAMDAMSLDEAREAMFAIMSGPQRKIFDALIPGEMSREELGQATGYSSGSGGFGNLLGSLRSLSIIDYPSKGRAALEPWVYQIIGGA